MNSPHRPYTGTSGDRRTPCPTGPCQSFPYPINPALPENSSLTINSNTPQYIQQMPTPSLTYLHLKTIISDILNSQHKPYTGINGGRLSPCPKKTRQSSHRPINPALLENSSLKLNFNTRHSFKTDNTLHLTDTLTTNKQPPPHTGRNTNTCNDYGVAKGDT